MYPSSLCHKPRHAKAGTVQIRKEVVLKVRPAAGEELGKQGKGIEQRQKEWRIMNGSAGEYHLARLLVGGARLALAASSG
jgi:hypothetical protein